MYHNMKLTVLTNQKDYVEESINLFVVNLISAIILVVAVVMVIYGAEKCSRCKCSYCLL